jgi:hypothetical protein
MRYAAQLSSACVRFHHLEKGIRVAVELGLTHAVDLAEGADCRRSLGRHVDQATIGEDYLGRHALFLGKPRAQAL